MSRCLVTGGLGFIGGAVVKALKNRQHDVEVFDIVRGQDVCDPALVRSAVEEADVVFDCSGKLGSAETFAAIQETLQVNIFGTLNVLEACREFNVPMIYMSLKNEWYNPYMISKHAGNDLCMMYHEYLGTHTCVIRGLNAYGPGQHWGAVRKMIPTFIVQALRGSNLHVYGDGLQIVDLLYVDDLAEIMIRAWECQAYGQEIDGGTGIPRFVVDVADTIIDLAASCSMIEYVPMRPGEPDRAVALADPTKALQLLDFYPETTLEEGLRRTIEWYTLHWMEMER